MKILVVDDSIFIAKQIRTVVEPEGYEVIGHAKSGEEGIKMYDELKPDIVTMDIIMPGIDGIETAKCILEKNPDAKIIMLSSLCDEDTIKEIEDIGVRYLIPKPMEDRLILSVLRRISKPQKINKK